MMLFCFYQLDSLVAEEDELLNIRHGKWIPFVETYLPLDEPIHHYVPNDAIVYNYYILD